MYNNFLGGCGNSWIIILICCGCGNNNGCGCGNNNSCDCGCNNGCGC